MTKSIDNIKEIEIDNKLIKRKKFLNKIYLDFYQKIRPINVPRGPIIEIGSGGGFLKEIIPEVITSDIIKGPNIDKIFFAEKIPYKNNSVSAFLMVDVLHHIKNSKMAFQEMERCLKPKGKIIILEPYNSVFGGLIYKYFHHEYYNPRANWNIKGKGRMSDSNTALPWIIFVRDKTIFKSFFPNLKVLKVEPHTPFAYLISGGLTKYQLLPNFTYPLIKFLEYVISPFNTFLGMFVTIEIQKLPFLG